jgi:hypothetical protein
VQDFYCAVVGVITNDKQTQILVVGDNTNNGLKKNKKNLKKFYKILIFNLLNFKNKIPNPPKHTFMSTNTE